MSTQVSEVKLDRVELERPFRTVVPKRQLKASQPVKRVCDVGICLLVAPLAVLIGLPIALAVKCDGGDIFYRQPRVGYGGRTFDCLKFRSMVDDADTRLEELLASDPDARRQWNSFQKLPVDPRVTRVGKMIRALSLDELPQIWNVLRGEMSIVGPRPIMISQVGLYGAAFDIYCQQRPGITGLWQVSGRNTKTFQDRVALDCEYARTWSVWRDIRLMLQTIPAVLARKGAH